MAKNHDNIGMCTARMHRWRLRVLICSFGHFATFTSFSIAVENAAKLQCFWSCDAVTSTNWYVCKWLLHILRWALLPLPVSNAVDGPSQPPAIKGEGKPWRPTSFKCCRLYFAWETFASTPPFFIHVPHSLCLLVLICFLLFLFPSFFYWCVLFFSVASGMYCVFLCVCAALSACSSPDRWTQLSLVEWGRADGCEYRMFLEDASGPALCVCSRTFNITPLPPIFLFFSISFSPAVFCSDGLYKTHPLIHKWRVGLLLSRVIRFLDICAFLFFCAAIYPKLSLDFFFSSFCVVQSCVKIHWYWTRWNGWSFHFSPKSSPRQEKRRKRLQTWNSSYACIM